MLVGCVDACSCATVAFNPLSLNDKPAAAAALQAVEVFENIPILDASSARWERKIFDFETWMDKTLPFFVLILELYQ